MSVNCASENLQETWRRLCLKAMDLEDWEVVETDATNTLEIIDLLPKLTSTVHSTQTDPWMTTALQIRSNINNMRNFIADKRSIYASLETDDAEASLIASTVSSFTATTANEIESLHTIQTKAHYAGIIQILMSDLKLHVAEPFANLQKQRHRKAMEIFHKPIFCEHEAVPFQPSRPSHRLHQDFMDSYNDTVPRVRRPTSMFAIAKSEEPDAIKRKPVPDTETTIKRDAKAIPTKLQASSVQETSYTSSEVLQQETIMLQQKTHSDLEGVQKMEQMMTDITSLISQFADLLVEQQEDIFDIYDSANTTKTNVDAGKENLVDAKDRTRNSNHYMAKSIFALSVILLIFHWLRP